MFAGASALQDLLSRVSRRQERVAASIEAVGEAWSRRVNRGRDLRANIATCLLMVWVG